MKKNTRYGTLAVVTLFCSITAAGTGDARKTGFPYRTEVSIDGRSFVAEESFSNDSTLLRRELDRLGSRPPETFDIPQGRRVLDPVFSGKLAGSEKPVPVVAPIMPRGLSANHTLRVSGDSQAVELAIGKLEPGGGPVSARLAAKGFVPVAKEGNGPSLRMLQSVRGKETTVVCVDETKGTFLLLRKLER